MGIHGGQIVINGVDFNPSFYGLDEDVMGDFEELIRAFERIGEITFGEMPFSIILDNM